MPYSSAGAADAVADQRALAPAVNAESGRYKQKSAYLRKRFTDEQAATRIATSPRARTGRRAGGADAVAAVLRGNAVPGRDGRRRRRHPARAEYYRDLYASTGGVPVPGDAADGCYINYPDIDMADPEWNTSGVPWHTLYFKDNYPRLQRVKAAWDPRNVFHHALSIRPPR